MGLTRGTPLVATVAAVKALVPKGHLTNLETGGELTLTQHLGTATDWVYDKLEKLGDPTKLTNETRYERAVAWYFMYLLAESETLVAADGDQGGLVTRYYEAAVRHFDDVWPRFSDSDDPRSGSEAIPRIKNISTDPLFRSLP